MMFVILNLFLQFLYAGPDCVNPLKAYLDTDFTIKFEQQTFYSFLPQPKTSQGTLIVSKDGKYSWDVKGQNAATIVSNGDTAWIYTPAEDDDPASVMVKPANSFFNTADVFSRCYTKKEVSIVKNNVAGVEYTKLILKNAEDNSYKGLSIEFVAKPFKITSIEFEDANSSKTVIKTTSFKKKKVKSSVFEFKIPQGTRIIK